MKVVYVFHPDIYTISPSKNRDGDTNGTPSLKGICENRKMGVRESESLRLDVDWTIHTLLLDPFTLGCNSKRGGPRPVFPFDERGKDEKQENLWSTYGTSSVLSGGSQQTHSFRWIKTLSVRVNGR